MSDLQIGVNPCQEHKIYDQNQADEYGVEDDDNTPGRVPAGCLTMIDESLATIGHSSVTASEVCVYRGSLRMWLLIRSGVAQTTA
jgi:hypothetical protein